MVIDIMFVYHFVDSDLKIEIFFEKEGLAENGGVDFEIGDIGTSALLYWRLKKISCKACLLFYCILATKIALLLICTFITLLLNSFCLATVQNRGKDTHTNVVADVFGGAGRRVFLFFLGEKIASSKVVHKIYIEI